MFLESNKDEYMKLYEHLEKLKENENKLDNLIFLLDKHQNKNMSIHIPSTSTNILISYKKYKIIKSFK